MTGVPGHRAVGVPTRRGSGVRSTDGWCAWRCVAGHTTRGPSSARPGSAPATRGPEGTGKPGKVRRNRKARGGSRGFERAWKPDVHGRVQGGACRGRRPLRSALASFGIRLVRRLLRSAPTTFSACLVRCRASFSACPRSAPASFGARPGVRSGLRVRAWCRRWVNTVSTANAVGARRSGRMVDVARFDGVSANGPSSPDQSTSPSFECNSPISRTPSPSFCIECDCPPPRRTARARNEAATQPRSGPFHPVPAHWSPVGAPRGPSCRWPRQGNCCTPPTARSHGKATGEYSPNG